MCVSIERVCALLHKPLSSHSIQSKSIRMDLRSMRATKLRLTRKLFAWFLYLCELYVCVCRFSSFMHDVCTVGKRTVSRRVPFTLPFFSIIITSECVRTERVSEWVLCTQHTVHILHTGFLYSISCIVDSFECSKMYLLHAMSVPKKTENYDADTRTQTHRQT